MSTVIAPEPRTPLDYALAYVARGYAVVPLHWVDDAGQCSCGRPHDGADGNPSPNSRGKHPHTTFARHGVHSASRDADVVRRWFEVEPRLNVGLATGEASGFLAVDIDPRDGGDVTWDDFVARNGGVVPPTAVANTGGGGLHLLFRYVADQVIRSPGKGVQIKSNGGYIVVEPSRHHSGRAYAWDAEADPLDGAPIADAPDWLVAPRAADVHALGGRRLTGYLDPQRRADLEAALAYIDADDYTTWVNVGMALHSTGAPEAFELWDTWSQRSDKYDAAGQRRKWASFGRRDGLHVESIFVWAVDRGWPGAATHVAVPAQSVTIAGPRPQGESAAALGLLELPGVLGEVVRLANRTAPKPQPVFAVGAALALGATCTGRRFRALPRLNWPSLYFVHVGKSGCGKEHARTVIDAVLGAADWPELIGRSGYASDSAVLSALALQPSHIAMIDEIGALLGNIQADGAFYARSAVTTLIEAWGALHGTLRPKAYSTASLTREQAEQMLKREVHNPAITLLGMTTPQTFYSALHEGSIEGGFLARLIVIETDIGRQPMGTPHPMDVPQSVIDWCQGCRRHAAARGNLGSLDVPAGIRPIPTDVPSDPAALRAFEAYERDVLARMETLEEEGLAELESRSVEKAMRIALILAVSTRVDAPRIEAAHADWAVAFVQHWTARMLAAVREHMHGSRFAQWQADVLRVIRRGADKGRTERELAKLSRTYDGLDTRQRRMVMDALIAKGAVALVDIATPGGRGRKRTAWVALDDGEDSVGD